MISPQGFPSVPASFEYETEVHQSTDGEHGIFFNWFKKKTHAPKRALLIIHGQGEHGGRYQHFTSFLENEYDVFLAPDLRGHGRSEGMRGHVDHFDEYVDDALLAFEILKSTYPEIEIDWFCHSMGGTVSLRVFTLRPDLNVKNLILSAPSLDLKVKVPFVKDLAARLIAKVWGSLQMETDLDAKKLSHDQAVVDAILKDQLHHTKATPQFYLSFLQAMEGLRSATLRIKTETRVLFQLAGEDEIVSTEAAEKYFESFKHERKDLILYRGLYHEIYNETTKDHVFHDLISWLKGGTKS